MARKNPSENQRERLFRKNAYVCCVCKQRGLGLHLHHIDGNSSNTVDENLAVLCVQDHDAHHRPQLYTSPNHLELGAQRIQEHKKSWEAFIVETTKPIPKVLAVINAFGDYSNIHSIKVVFQWQDGSIEFERTYHLLDGPMEKLIDSIFEELDWLGANIKLMVFDEPLTVEYCPCCQTGYSRTLDENIATRFTSETWKQASTCTIFINPQFPSLAISVFLKDESIYSGHLHLCGNYLHYHSDKLDERVPIRRKPSIRTQATKIVRKILNMWEPGKVLIGTGDHDHPHLIDDLELPKVWETR